jgi:methyltransferase
MVVALEIPLLPLVFGLTSTAAAFGTLNLVVLAIRIRAEDLAWRESKAQSLGPGRGGVR